MNFPIMNIGLEEWTQELLIETGHLNNMYFRGNYELFRTNILHKEFVDCNGNIFTVRGKQDSQSFWSKIFGFKRYKVFFSSTSKSMTLQDLKDYIHNMFSDSPSLTKDPGMYLGYLDEVQKAKSFREIMEL